MHAVLLFLFLASTAKAQFLNPVPAPHVDLEASSSEIFAHLLRSRGVHFLQTANQERPEFQRVIEVGQRNLDWLKHMNSKRDVPLQFTKPGDLRGIPIDKPKSYSEVLVIAKFKKLSEEILPQMQEVLLKNQPFTDNPPEPLEKYIEFGRKLDAQYQSALRWIMMRNYLPFLEQRRRQDIRGYYFLSRVDNLEAKIRDYGNQTPEMQANLKTWLQMNCYVTQGSDSICSQRWSEDLQDGKLLNYHNDYWIRARNTYNSFFDLRNPRRDVKWATPNEMRVTIQRDLTQEQLDFLKINLEDEWTWNGWRMIVDFTADAWTQVHWEPGVTPHVDGLGGNNIYMNLETPLTEWDTKWTIRHEYGHALGLPDCYVEFYSAPERAIVNYQIDVDDLMCSRKGKINQRIFDELVEYYRK